MMPIISFAMAIALFLKFWPVRDLLDKDTIRLIRIVKTTWGKNLSEVKYERRDKGKAYKSGQAKFMEGIKGMVPGVFQPVLEEFTPEEMQEYIFNEDTVKFFIKVKDLVGGFELPKLPGGGEGYTIQGRGDEAYLAIQLIG